MRPSSADTSDPACVKRKMLSMKRSTSLPSPSRKYSATVSADRPTRKRAPGGSVICPYTSAARDLVKSCVLTTPLSWNSSQRSLPSRAFADAAEHRHAAVLHGDVVDQLHDDY